MSATISRYWKIYTFTFSTKHYSTVNIMVKIRLQNIAETNVTIVQVPIQAGNNSAAHRQHPSKGMGTTDYATATYVIQWLGQEITRNSRSDSMTLHVQHGRSTSRRSL